MTMRSGWHPTGRASKCVDSTCRVRVRRPVTGSTCIGKECAVSMRPDHAKLSLQMSQPKSPSGTAPGRNDPAAAANRPWRERDLAHVWHPCTQMKDHDALLPMIPIRSASGVWLNDFAGQRYLDAISSWWVNLFGHANPRINAAVRAQLESLEHVILAGFTHEPVIRLSEALTALAPAGLTRCFYADNGSSAVEVAVKMSFHYWRNMGHTAKRRFV